ncbi:hypothetical protein [Rhodococcus opacus]|uniref:hypothetical protein n=1 Tax=Rhodococcus opacus TaxID=37919 RepID=UPI001C201E39|nr:hypothetical protein [Rhodococcus opacus]
MDQPVPRHRQDRPRQRDRDDAAPSRRRGERGEELLARAVAATLAQGTSWAQLAAHLGVPDPCTTPHCTCSDLHWQNAIVEHENARSHRVHTPGPEPDTHRE